jgi:NhaP-type Na+/H+ or K+/H+ antiporter
LVAGESTLNDAAGMTLYGFFLALSATLNNEPISAAVPFVAIAQFLVIALGGAAWGLLFGILASLTSRFSGAIAVFEPLYVLLFGSISFIFADW